MNKIKKALSNPILLITHLCRHWPFRCISDKKYLELFFRAHQGKKLNLSDPKSFNEKLQWLKLYDRRDEYTMMSDKYLVREYIKNRIGEEYLIPLLGVWENAKDINYASLPEQFVLKCNHDSGSVVICKNKNNIDKKSVEKKLQRALNRQYYWTSREWNYKNIKPRIIAEKYLVDETENDLKDYKFFCFSGEPRFIQVDSGRFSNHIRNFYTTEWEFIPAEYGCKNDKNMQVNKPNKLNEMLELARLLSKGIPHVRVDFYLVNNKIYFGELTFHHGGGVMKLEPYSYDLLWGSYLNLKETNRYS